MPLPDATSLSLRVSSSAVQSKPKCAMIVRMSAETLDALEAFPNHPPLSFDFGDSPGIYIGDTFFPMRPQKENSPHELYLRAASTAKPMAPLKLHANVIGKFMVERQLGDRVTDKVRQQTMVAKQQQMERHAILLDQPPIPVSAAKSAKRKVPGSGTVVKKRPASEHLRPPSSASLTPPKVSPSLQTTPSTRASADVRRRLVHYLAISPRLSEDAVKMVGGANITDSARADLLALLEDVAEQQAPAKKGDKSPRQWVLKPQSWTEVRPFEWPKLTEAGRVVMARQARMAFKALGILESDPAWDNVRYRSTAAPTISSSIPAPPPMTASNSSRSSTSTQAETKRSAIATKDTKLKSKQDVSRTKGEIQMKDESTKATVSRVNAIKRAEAERPTTPSDGGNGMKTVVSRRLPGSGYQAKKSPQPSPGTSDKAGTSVDPRTAPKASLSAPPPSKPSLSASPAGGTHARKTIPTVPLKPVKREEESDRERGGEHERQKEREREKREREKERQRDERERDRDEMEKRERARQMEREAVEREKRQREKEREREDMEREKRWREKERIAKERGTSGAVPAFRQKTMTQGTEGTLDDASSKAPPSKRRKLDNGTCVSSSSKAQDGGLPELKKSALESSPVPHFKMKKEPSPPQILVSNRERRATTQAGGSMHKSERPSKVTGSAKPRRRSPIYTSSEDEGEIPQPRKRNPSPPSTSDRSNSSNQPPSERTSRHHRTSRTVYPPPTDHAALRALYQSQYTDYLGTFSKIVAQKRKIEAMLNGDSEGEVDVMDPDDLVKLSMEHKSLKTELENIHDIYTKGTTAAGRAATSANGSSWSTSG